MVIHSEDVGMWVIRCEFKDGTWYRGVTTYLLLKNAKIRLLNDLDFYHPKADRIRRGGGTYKIFWSKTTWKKGLKR